MWKHIRRYSSGCFRCWRKRSCSKGRRIAWTRRRWKPTLRRVDCAARHRRALRRVSDALAKESGIETPTREQLAKLDRKRPKKGSNDDWTHLHDPDARITKMKDGARIWLTRSSMRWTWRPERSSPSHCTAQMFGDTTTIPETIAEAGERITSVVADTQGDEAVKQVSTDGPREVVTDKGY